jgi:hypothetical protein
MAKKDSNFDKNFLIFTAAAAVAGGAWLYTMKSSFAEQLQSKKAQRRNDFPEVPTAEVSKASEMLRKAFMWEAPTLKGKLVTLNKSVPVIMQGGKLFDLFADEPQLRPPMTNKFLRDHQLEYLSPNVGDLDPDEDGFSNLEEFNGQTNPRDRNSKPPLETKVYFVNRVQDDYILKLLNKIIPAQVKRMSPTPQKSVFIDVTPKTFGFDPASQERFTAQNFANKRVGETEVAEMTMVDNATKETFVLTYGVEKNLAEYQAELEFRLGVVTKIKVKKGDTFYLPNVATKYLLQDVTETEAIIAPIGSDGYPGKAFVAKPKS